VSQKHFSFTTDTFLSHLGLIQGMAQGVWSLIKAHGGELWGKENAKRKHTK